MDKIEISVDVITGEVTQKVSEFTAEELVYSAQVTAQAEADAQTAIDIRASALAKLAALGFTQDEVKALVG
jgi:hypothetical protein